RAAELAALVPDFFDLDATPPAVILPPEMSKNRKGGGSTPRRRAGGGPADVPQGLAGEGSRLAAIGEGRGKSRWWDSNPQPPLYEGANRAFSCRSAPPRHILTEPVSARNRFVLRDLHF